MFVRYYVDIPLPFGSVESMLLESPERWVPGLADDAQARADNLMAEVGFGSNGHRLGKRVVIEIREPIRFASRTLVPMSWVPTGPDGLFPGLEADIEIAPLGPNRTQLSISARYKPPMGLVGQVADRALLHRVAEATIKDFLDRAAESISQLAPSGADGVTSI
jgi:hypothetical protein